jgi:16S rRNA (cytosine1407-C5)-methyltransferase
MANLKINTVKSKKELFKEKISEIYPNDSKYIIDFHNDLKVFKSFRICNLNHQKILNSLSIDRVKFKHIIDNIYQTTDVESSDKLSKSTAFMNNEIYIQELSSTLPVLIAKSLIKDNKLKILDLCASPGSKTTQLAESYVNSKIYANEPNRSRFFKLKQILSDYKCEASLINLPAQKIQHIKPDFKNSFDLIICDAPCSNEGSLNLGSGDTLKYWSEKEPAKISKIQKGILKGGYDLLKSEGILIYSTCTYSVEENEMVIDWLLKRNSTAKAISLNFSIPEMVFKIGLTSYKNKQFHPEVKNSLRVMPKNGFKSFFICALTKK